jgi:ABC-2 type transport system ATP-binding protein
VSSDPIITASGLTKRFGGFTAVDAVSFEVARGEIFGYLGANGAGKSTTIRMLCGLLPPTEGSAVVAGQDIHHPTKVKRAIGYMSQKFSLYQDLTVEENLQFFAGAYGLSGKRRKERITASLEMAELTDRRTVLTRALPGGIRQRLALASSLLHEPQVLFLDEPTAGVDPAARRGFWRVIRQLARAGTTLFVTTHHLDEAEYCERVGLMVDGRLVALDTPRGLKRTHVPGTMLAVSGAAAAALRVALAGQPDVLQIQPFGQAVHVRVRGELSDPAHMEQALRERAIAARVEPAEATLEDVFLELVGASGRAAAGGA